MTIASYRLKLTRVNSLKVKVGTRIPAQFEAETPLALERTNGLYSLSLDIAELRETLDSVYAQTPIDASNLPLPTSTTLGGVKSLANSANKWLNSIGTDGVPTSTQPAFSNLSGNIAVSQMASGSGASSSTFWRGDGAWASPSVSYTQAETGAVSRTDAQRFSNTLFAHEFGAVGDNSTNDRVALQAFLDAVASSGKVGHLDPGKKYYVSGGNLTITNGAANNGFTLYGHGSQIRTDPTQARTALRITRPTYTPSRYEEARITLIDGLSFNAFQDGNAEWGIDATGVINLTIRNCSFTSGADGGTAPSANYSAIRLRQTDITDPDTGCFWVNIENCSFKGGATGMPNAIWMEGAVNAVNITKNNFANIDTPVRLLAADRTGTDTANAATIPNGVNITHNWFEGITEGIKFNGNTTTANKSRSVGLMIQNNRIEAVSVSGVFFTYNGINLDSEAPPILGPNYLDSGSWGRYISNSNALTIDVRDELVRKTTIDPASLAANASATIGTVTVNSAVVGDQVRVEMGSDTGLLVSGYVSASNTVTIRLTNPTSSAVDLASTNFFVRVRPKY